MTEHLPMSSKHKHITYVRPISYVGSGRFYKCFHITWTGFSTIYQVTWFVLFLCHSKEGQTCFVLLKLCFVFLLPQKCRNLSFLVLSPFPTAEGHWWSQSSLLNGNLFHCYELILHCWTARFFMLFVGFSLQTVCFVF